MKKTAVSLMLTASLLALGLFVPSRASYKAYKMKDFAKNGMPGARIVFYQEDFTSNVIGGGTLTGIMPVSQPAADVGVLVLEGKSVALGSVIPADMLSRLVFIPASDAEFSAVVSFVPIFGGATADINEDGTDITINLKNEINNSPAATDLAFETQENLKIEIPLSAYDPENDALTYTVTGVKGSGSLYMSGNSLIFEPQKNKTGKTVISYYAKDSAGNTSGIASVTVTVEKPASDLVYADLAGSTKAYAAIKMAEAGVFVGEQYGTTFLFSPDKAMTRGEFVALAMTALEIGPDENVVLLSEGISSWQGSYMATALSLGAIDDLDASGAIDGTEAASICVKLLGIKPDIAAGLDFSSGNVKYCASALGLVTDPALYDKALTRADAIELLYRLTAVSSGERIGWKTVAK